jgi:flagellar biosynthesis protein FlhF
MRSKTFRAPTMADALAAVKRDLGRDAVILHTRTARIGGWGWLGEWFGWGARPVVEIVASADVNVAGPRPKAPPAPPAPHAGDPTDGPLSCPPLRLSPAAVARAYGRAPDAAQAVSAGDGPSAQVLPVRRTGGRDAGGSAPSAPTAVPLRPAARLAVPAPLAPQDSAAHASLQEELAAIRRMVGQVLQSSSPAAAAPLMPEALFRQYLRLLEGQVARELADRVVAAVRDELSPAELADESIVRQTLLRHLAAMIPAAPGTAAPSRAADGRPTTIALVGPTGVGKTTTVAKLAATFRLRYGRKVGLITCDTYRIAAVDQLRTYASIIAVPLKVVLTPPEMAAACDALADCDVVLIDTAGRSPHDAARLDELAAFLAAAAPHQTHLVLSTTASEPALLAAADRFAVASPSHVILTKLDEAVNFGILVNVAQRVRATLSFVTTGQEVPDHIEPGHADRLARLVLDGTADLGGVGLGSAGAAPPASSAAEPHR